LALIAAEADLALEEIGERLAARGIQVAASLICWFYDRHGISFRKNRARRGSARIWRAPGRFFGGKAEDAIRDAEVRELYAKIG